MSPNTATNEEEWAVTAAKLLSAARPLLPSSVPLPCSKSSPAGSGRMLAPPPEKLPPGYKEGAAPGGGEDGPETAAGLCSVGQSR